MHHLLYLGSNDCSHTVRGWYSALRCTTGHVLWTMTAPGAYTAYSSEAVLFKSGFPSKFGVRTSWLSLVVSVSWRAVLGFSDDCAGWGSLHPAAIIHTANHARGWQPGAAPNVCFHLGAIQTKPWVLGQAILMSDPGRRGSQTWTHSLNRPRL